MYKMKKILFVNIFLINFNIFSSLAFQSDYITEMRLKFQLLQDQNMRSDNQWIRIQKAIYACQNEGLITQEQCSQLLYDDVPFVSCSDLSIDYDKDSIVGLIIFIEKCFKDYDPTHVNKNEAFIFGNLVSLEQKIVLWQDYVEMIQLKFKELPFALNAFIKKKALLSKKEELKYLRMFSYLYSTKTSIDSGSKYLKIRREKYLKSRRKKIEELANFFNLSMIQNFICNSMFKELFDRFK